MNIDENLVCHWAKLFESQENRDRTFLVENEECLDEAHFSLDDIVNGKARTSSWSGWNTPKREFAPSSPTPSASSSSAEPDGEPGEKKSNVTYIKSNLNVMRLNKAFEAAKGDFFDVANIPDGFDENSLDVKVDFAGTEDVQNADSTVTKAMPKVYFVFRDQLFGRNIVRWWLDGSGRPLRYYIDIDGFMKHVAEEYGNDEVVTWRALKPKVFDKENQLQETRVRITGSTWFDRQHEEIETANGVGWVKRKKHVYNEDDEESEPQDDVPPEET